MQTYSIADAVKELDVDRKTLRRWAKDNLIPIPKPGTVKGRLVKCWNEKEMEKVRQFHANNYGGKGIDRREGSRVEQRKNKKK
jgi:predicted site-specific integrase-resolvase